MEIPENEYVYFGFLTPRYMIRILNGACRYHRNEKMVLLRRIFPGYPRDGKLRFCVRPKAHGIWRFRRTHRDVVVDRFRYDPDPDFGDLG